MSDEEIDRLHDQWNDDNPPFDADFCRLVAQAKEANRLRAVLVELADKIRAGMKLQG